MLKLVELKQQAQSRVEALKAKAAEFCTNNQRGIRAIANVGLYAGGIAICSKATGPFVLATGIVLVVVGGVGATASAFEYVAAAVGESKIGGAAAVSIGS